MAPSRGGITRSSGRLAQCRGAGHVPGWDTPHYSWGWQGAPRAGCARTVPAVASWSYCPPGGLEAHPEASVWPGTVHSTSCVSSTCVHKVRTNITPVYRRGNRGAKGKGCPQIQELGRGRAGMRTLASQRPACVLTRWQGRVGAPGCWFLEGVPVKAVGIASGGSSPAAEVPILGTSVRDSLPAHRAGCRCVEGPASGIALTLVLRHCCQGVSLLTCARNTSPQSGTCVRTKHGTDPARSPGAGRPGTHSAPWQARRRGRRGGFRALWRGGGRGGGREGTPQPNPRTGARRTRGQESVLGPSTSRLRACAPTAPSTHSGRTAPLGRRAPSPLPRPAQRPHTPHHPTRCLLAPPGCGLRQGARRSAPWEVGTRSGVLTEAPAVPKNRAWHPVGAQCKAGSDRKRTKELVSTFASSSVRARLLCSPECSG